MNNRTHQEQLAVEFISPKYCSACRFYCYNKDNQVCLFHSAPIEDCNIIKLNIEGKLKHESRNQNIH